jgi:hypothetical protein
MATPPADSPKPDSRRARVIHSMPAAKRRFVAIINKTLAGAPQAIQTRDGRRVVVISVDAVQALLERAGKIKPTSNIERPARTRIGLRSVFRALVDL